METLQSEPMSKSQNDVVRWYPMRIFHSSVKRQYALNDLLIQEPAVERTYVPKNLVVAEDQTYVPTLVNYIFIRTSRNGLKTLKADRHKYEHLRYVMSRDRDESYTPVMQIAYVPDKQMNDFMRTIDEANEHVQLLQNMAFACRPGQKVRICKGPFEGVEGVVKSIRKHLCVVIAIQDVMAVAITNVPKKYLERIDIE